ncbi:FecR family protein [Dyadobacter tibetensis]|uniref:FecR family protein n=1 Tax=Dyadobacter tibetensis TaxID=1211851 RepID=UPI00046EB8FA|nr:FecR domain-containing protein [Dyadobacter tibetensis]
MKHHKGTGFLALLQRYIGNSTTSQEKKAMDIWYDSLGDPSENMPTSEEKSVIEKRIWGNVEKLTTDRNPLPASRPVSYWNHGIFRIGLAASVILTLGFIYFFTELGRTSSFPAEVISKEEIESLEKVINDGSAPKTVNLADGSSVVLDADATLYFPKTFHESHRTVYLDGDGFFDIAKDPQKPFLVYSGDIVTKVLGTSFTIHRDKESGKMEVAVITGKVIVEKSNKSSKYFESKDEGFTLRPNEKVSYLPEKQEYVTGLVDKPVLIEKSEGFIAPSAFIFDDTALSTILGKLERAYGVEIQVQNKAIMNCTVTADLGTDDLFSQLDILNALLNAESTVTGKVIVIRGGECKPFINKNRMPM